MSDMIERVARAIHDGLGGDGWAYTNYGGNEFVDCRDKLEAAAIAAIKAMREATTEMLVRVEQNLLDQYRRSNADEPKALIEDLDVEELWTSAIDSILSTQPEKEQP